jgi:hypothetical protein
VIRVSRVARVVSVTCASPPAALLLGRVHGIEVAHAAGQRGLQHHSI